MKTTNGHSSEKTRRARLTNVSTPTLMLAERLVELIRGSLLAGTTLSFPHYNAGTGKIYRTAGTQARSIIGPSRLAWANWLAYGSSVVINSAGVPIHLITPSCSRHTRSAVLMVENWWVTTTLAAFSIAFAFNTTFSGVISIETQAAMAYVTDKRSFWRVARFYLCVSLLPFLLTQRGAGILAVEEAARERLVDDERLRRVGRHGLRERPPGGHLDAVGLDEADAGEEAVEAGRLVEALHQIAGAVAGPARHLLGFRRAADGGFAPSPGYDGGAVPWAARNFAPRC